MKTFQKFSVAIILSLLITNGHAKQSFDDYDSGFPDEQGSSDDSSGYADEDYDQHDPLAQQPRKSVGSRVLGKVKRTFGRSDNYEYYEGSGENYDNLDNQQQEYGQSYEQQPRKSLGSRVLGKVKKVFRRSGGENNQYDNGPSESYDTEGPFGQYDGSNPSEAVRVSGGAGRAASRAFGPYDQSNPSGMAGDATRRAFAGPSGNNLGNQRQEYGQSYEQQPRKSLGSRVFGKVKKVFRRSGGENNQYDNSPSENYDTEGPFGQYDGSNPSEAVRVSGGAGRAASRAFGPYDQSNPSGMAGDATRRAFASRSGNNLGNQQQEYGQSYEQQPRKSLGSRVLGKVKKVFRRSGGENNQYDNGPSENYDTEGPFGQYDGSNPSEVAQVPRVAGGAASRAFGGREDNNLKSEQKAQRQEERRSQRQQKRETQAQMKAEKQQAAQERKQQKLYQRELAQQQKREIAAKKWEAAEGRKAEQARLKAEKRQAKQMNKVGEQKTRASRFGSFSKKRADKTTQDRPLSPNHSTSRVYKNSSSSQELF